MRLKLFIAVLWCVISILVVGCTVSAERDTDVVDNQSELEKVVPEYIADKLSYVIGTEEKDFYDEFVFVSYDSEELIVELKATIAGKELPLYYKYDEESNDFMVYNGK